MWKAAAGRERYACGETRWMGDGERGDNGDETAAGLCDSLLGAATSGAGDDGGDAK